MTHGSELQDVFWRYIGRTFQQDAEFSLVQVWLAENLKATTRRPTRKANRRRRKARVEKGTSWCSGGMASRVAPSGWHTGTTSSGLGGLATIKVWKHGGDPGDPYRYGELDGQVFRDSDAAFDAIHAHGYGTRHYAGPSNFLSLRIPQRLRTECLRRPDRALAMIKRACTAGRHPFWSGEVCTRLHKRPRHLQNADIVLGGPPLPIITDEQADAEAWDNFEAAQDAEWEAREANDEQERLDAGF